MPNKFEDDYKSALNAFNLEEIMAVLTEAEARGFSKTDSEQIQLKWLHDQFGIMVGKPFDALPSHYAQQLSDVAKSVASHAAALLKNISKYYDQGPEQFLQKLRDNITNLDKRVKGFVLIAVPAISYVAAAGEDFAARVKEEQERVMEMRGRVATHEQTAFESLSAIKGVEEEASTLLNDIKVKKDRISISAFGEKFSGQAAKHEKRAGNWLSISIFLFVITLEAAVAFMWSENLRAFFPEHEVYGAIAKSVFLASGFGFAFYCARNHRSEKHLQSTYEHKAMAIGTFEMFMNSSENQAIQEQILIETSRLVFAPTVSGYLGAGENMPQMPVGEFLKTLSQPKPTS